MGSRSRCSRTWRLPQLVKTRPLVRQAPLPAWLNTSTMLQVIATTNPGLGFFFRNIWSTFIKTLYTLSCWNMAVREISGWRSGRDWLSPRSPSCPSCPSCTSCNGFEAEMRLETHVRPQRFGAAGFRVLLELRPKSKMHIQMHICKACYEQYILLHMYACMYTSMYVLCVACMHACMHACMYVCMYACLYVCVHACMHLCMYACL